MVSLVLVDSDGAPLGALPPFAVAVPYWQEVEAVVSAARDRHGVDATVLRILSAERPVPPGGAVTYLAEAGEVPPGSTRPVEVDRADHPARCAYARPGGPAASLGWAAAMLAERGCGAMTPVQQRTWNLSAIWRLDTGRDPVWLKQVPHFFAHESQVLGCLAASGLGTLVPPLLAAHDGRMLLGHVAGEDRYGAGIATRAGIAGDMHRIQVAMAGRLDTLLAAGVPDRRAVPLAAALAAVVARYGAGDPRLDALTSGLDERLAAVARCGVPDTLVHGDLHPGNVRGTRDGADHRIIDWGDSFIGHPGFDILRLTDDLDPAEADDLLDDWAARWSVAVPGCAARAAVDLLRPVAALRNAAVYANFLANIEPTEYPYHAADVGIWLATAAESAAPVGMGPEGIAGTRGVIRSPELGPNPLAGPTRRFHR